ncbi:MAG TPA: SDR family oxidoreductase [Terriglobia bacterium]|nr:SDR family oxidoreductase [Terriglobia bacterium]
MPKHVLVTGATGFVGSHLTNRLLKDGHRVTALARGSKTSPARDRILDILTLVSGADSQHNAGLERLSVLEGDISQPNLGVAHDALQKIVGSIDETWHCAASLSFAEEERDEIFLMNVEGARNVIEVVKQTPKKRLHHISTAYVAGIRDTALESEINVGQKFRNPYEASKCQAEELVDKERARGSIVPTVYRPSVVIGDSRTGRVTHYHGVYAFIRGLWSTLERMRRKNPSNGNIHLSLRVPGSGNTTLNFVPIDYVVNGMVEIGGRDSSIGNTYHLANPEATPNHVWLPAVCRLLGMEGLRFVDPQSFVDEPPNRLEALFKKHMAFYYMYLQGEPRFDCRQALEALRNTGIECPPVTEAFTNMMIRWYIDFLRNEAASAH